MSSALEALRPTTRARVMDLVREAGVEVRNWKKFKRGPTKASVNPRYCYEWAFLRKGRVVVLNLWHGDLKEDRRGIYQRIDLHQHRRNQGKPVWVARASRMNDAIRTAARERLPLRVIICDGRKRTSGGPKVKASRVLKRHLDPTPWAVTDYDEATGDWLVRRGARPTLRATRSTARRIVDPRPSFSRAQIRKALRAVEASASESQLAMLRAHYYAPDHTASMRDLALCGGYESYRAANLQYGNLCGLLAKELRYTSPHDNVFVLASVIDEPDENGHSLWKMDTHFVRALEELAWVRADAMSGPGSDTDAGTASEEASGTTGMSLVEIRRGQRKFRADVLALWKTCSVTNCDHLAVMVASHIVPWKSATDRERLDPGNGLLLTPNLDRLFDKHWITFHDSGRIRLSEWLARSAYQLLGVTGREGLRMVPSRMLPYLRRHRRAFEKTERKRSRTHCATSQIAEMH